jgi:putative transcriptional regulator
MHELNVTKFAQDFPTSLQRATAHARGSKVNGLRVTAVEIPDVKAVCRSLRMS